MTIFDSDDDNIFSSRSNDEFKSLSGDLQVKNKERRERLEQLKTLGLLRELMNGIKRKRSGNSGSS